MSVWSWGTGPLIGAGFPLRGAGFPLREQVSRCASRFPAQEHFIGERMTLKPSIDPANRLVATLLERETIHSQPNSMTVSKNKNSRLLLELDCLDWTDPAPKAKE